MRWRVVRVPEQDQTEHDLTSSELIAISVLLTRWHRQSGIEDDSVYWRARQKIQPQVSEAHNDDQD
jgi:hypothetical protein